MTQNYLPILIFYSKYMGPMGGLKMPPNGIGYYVPTSCYITLKVVFSI